MTDTYSQIAGSLGLPQNATKDMFKKQEDDVLAATQRALRELRSTSMESLSGRGMGLSTFGDQAIKKQETDVLSNTLSSLNLNQSNFLQNLLGQKFTSDLNIDQIKATGDIKSQGNKEVTMGNMLTELLKNSLTSTKSAMGDSSDLLGNDLLGQLGEIGLGAGSFAAQSGIYKNLMNLWN